MPRWLRHTVSGTAAALVVSVVAASASVAPCDDLSADGQSNGIPILWVENG